MTILKKRLAIIPARIGSKRIPKKNIKNFAGKPMLHHILEAALSSNLFYKIHVSTDSPQVEAIAQEIIGKTDFLRPVNLALDDTPLLPVLNYVVNKFEEQNEFFDEIWLLMACSPLITSDDLISISNQFNAYKEKTPQHDLKMLSVAKFPAPIEWALELCSDNLLKAKYPELMSEPSQAFKDHYYDAGLFCIYSRAAFSYNIDNGMSKPYLPYVIQRNKALDIDTREQWEEALELFNFMKIS